MDFCAIFHIICIKSNGDKALCRDSIGSYLFVSIQNGSAFHRVEHNAAGDLIEKHAVSSRGGSLGQRVCQRHPDGIVMIELGCFLPLVAYLSLNG